MRKLINDPFEAVDEMLDGVLLAHQGTIRRTSSGRGLVVTDRDPQRRVGVVVGGGSGHEPAFFGYLGRGLADGVAVGNVFASPSATPAVELGRELGQDEGVVFLYGNYEGDIMNFGMASELLADLGIRSESVLVTDDVASSPSSVPDRRGVAGDAVVFKVAGARADEGASFDEVLAAASHANAHTRTVGVGLGPCIVPTAGKATFELPDGEMDIGMGVHGEAGIRRGRLRSADEVTDEIVAALLDDWPNATGEVTVMVNTLGATPLMEGYIVLRRVAQLLDRHGLELHRALVGEYVTSLEMAGLSVTFVSLDDDLKRLLDARSSPLSAPRLGVA